MSRPSAKNRGCVNGGLRTAAHQRWETGRREAMQPMIDIVREAIGNAKAPAVLEMQERIVEALTQRATASNRDVRDIFKDVVTEELFYQAYHVPEEDGADTRPIINTLCIRRNELRARVA